MDFTGDTEELLLPSSPAFSASRISFAKVLVPSPRFRTVDGHLPVAMILGAFLLKKGLKIVSCVMFNV